MRNHVLLRFEVGYFSDALLCAHFLSLVTIPKEMSISTLYYPPGFSWRRKKEGQKMNKVGDIMNPNSATRHKWRKVSGKKSPLLRPQQECKGGFQLAANNKSLCWFFFDYPTSHVMWHEPRIRKFTVEKPYIQLSATCACLAFMMRKQQFEF